MMLKIFGLKRATAEIQLYHGIIANQIAKYCTMKVNICDTYSSFVSKKISCESSFFLSSLSFLELTELCS